MKTILILGSESDRDFATQIESALDAREIAHETFVASAHKKTKEVLDIVAKFENEKVVFVTVAGRSNALSGVVAANSTKPVLACPPFRDKTDYSVNIHSTLQMPSGTPVLAILDPGNCAESAARILNLN
jgi:5-(carboxyamino)imidazole ribonucleotide mutase